MSQRDSEPRWWVYLIMALFCGLLILGYVIYGGK